MTTPTLSRQVATLRRGDQLPAMRVPPPGPRSKQLSQRARQAEAPGINTLYKDHDNVFWREAKGGNVLDVDGNRYIDFTAGFGVAAVGHQHPDVLAAVHRQGDRLLHGLGDAMGHPRRVELAEHLQEIAPVDDPKVYFAVSGADAIEVAIKTLLLASDRQRLLVFQPSYHGLTFGALAASSRESFREPFEAHIHANLDRLDFGCDISHIESHLEKGDVAGVLLEPIVGREGVLLPPKGWLRQVADLCKQHNVPLVADEIFTGFGRTGALFAVDHDNVRPDILCCGKALAGGLPIGVVIGRSDLMDAWTTQGEALHTATFVAHPLACAAALASLKVIETTDLVDHARQVGDDIRRRVQDWTTRYPIIQEIRGLGMLWGFQMRDAEIATQLTQQLMASGLLLLAGGEQGNVVQWVPPLNIHNRQLRWAVDAFESHLRNLSGTPDETDAPESQAENSKA